VRIQDASRTADWLFTLPAFYAEFAPLPRHRMWADHLYVMRDCGNLTAAGRTVFASLLWDVRLMCTEDGRASPQLTLVEPRFGRRKRRRAFHGWMLGVRGRAFSMSSTPPEDQVALKDWSRAAAETIRERSLSSADILMILDQLLDRLSEQPEPPCSGQVDRFLSLSSLEPGVTRLASLLGQSARTLQRRLRFRPGCRQSGSWPSNGSAAPCARSRPATSSSLTLPRTCASRTKRT
jgi:hypothetical protein